jgi:hypothetical protein
VENPLIPGGNTTRYQRLDIGTGWCYHPILMWVEPLVPVITSILWYRVVLYHPILKVP